MPQTRHAAYGTACSHCSRSKSRCVINDTGEPCQRCQRLNKNCDSASKINRRRSRYDAISIRGNQLEAKIDGLVSLLTSTTRYPTDSLVAHADDVSASVTQISSLKQRSLTAALAFPIDHQLIMNEFLTIKHPHFPFLALHVDSLASTFLETKPFLWLCIVAVSIKSTSQQQNLYAEIRTILAQSMVAELERNIELLQGLLVCITWGDFQVNKRPFLTLFTQLATTVVFDLGLNKAPYPIAESIAKLRFHQSSVSGTRTSEERRALLACWFISSVVSSFLHQIDGLSWTQHMGDCLQHLAEAEEYPEDVHLVAMVKIRQIVQKAYYSPMDNYHRDRSLGQQIPLAFVADVLRNDLGRLRSEIVDISQDTIIHYHLYYAEFAIHEFGIICNDQSTSPTGLYVCKQALELCLDVFLSYHPSKLPGFTLFTIYQLMHCTLCLHKIEVQLGTSSASLTQSELRLSRVKQVVQQLKEVAFAAEIRQDGPPVLFAKLATMIERRVSERDSSPHEPNGTEPGIEDIDLQDFSVDQVLALFSV